MLCESRVNGTRLGLRVAVQVSRRDQPLHLARAWVEDDHLLLTLVEASAAGRASGQLLHGKPDVDDDIIVGETSSQTAMLMAMRTAAPRQKAMTRLNGLLPWPESTSGPLSGQRDCRDAPPPYRLEGISARRARLLPLDKQGPSQNRPLSSRGSRVRPAGLSPVSRSTRATHQEGLGECPAFLIADAPTICFPNRGPVLDVHRYGCNIDTPHLLR